MADEAVIRIRLEDGGVQSANRQSAPPQRQQPALPAGKSASFDPYSEASRRREAEVRREQVKAAYADLYGGSKKGLDHLLDLAEKFRGVLGGTFGQLVGAALDVVAAFREIGKRTPQIPTLKPATDYQAVPTNWQIPETSEFEAVPTTLKAGQKAINATPYRVAKPTGQMAAPTTAKMGGAPTTQAASAGAEAAEAAGMTAAEIVPVIGAIVAAAAVAVKAVDAIGRAAYRIPFDVATAIATPDSDTGKAAQSAGNALTSFGDKVLFITPALGILAHETGELIGGFGRLMGAVDQAADHYARYNVPLAQAQAIGEIRQIYGDFRRAQLLGPNLTKYSLAKSKLDQDVEDIKANLLNRLLPLLTDVVKGVDVGVTHSGDILGLLTEVAVSLAGAPVIGALLKEAIKKFLEPKPQDIDFTPTLDILNLRVGVPNQ